MGPTPSDEDRETRIRMEIIVDAYGPEEQALGWYYYLEEQLHVPFRATCTTKHATSPLRAGDEVEVVGMPGEDVCEHGMFVLIAWDDDTLAVPMSRLAVVDGDAETRRAVEDWHFWVARGYEL